MFLVSFSFNVLFPIIILLLISLIIPVILNVLKLEFIPVFILEIIAGMIIGSFSIKKYFSGDLVEGVFTIGMMFLLFLSGMDADYSVIKHRDRLAGHRINVLKLSIIMLVIVVMLSFGISFFFDSYIINNNYWWGILMITTCLFGTFASVVVPLIKENKHQKTTIGRFVSTYSLLSELLSIIIVSVVMMGLGMKSNQRPWLIVIVVVTLIIVYCLERFVSVKRFNKMMGGVVHLGVRFCLVVLLTLVVLTEYTGAEFILGAFLAGMVMKAAEVSKPTVEKLESIGYGIFIPMFFIVVGTEIPIITLLKDFEIFKLTIIIFGCLLLVKIPLLYLYRWYKTSTVIPTILLVSCTVIVALTAKHLNILSEGFCDALILADAATCLITPIIFQINKKYGILYAKKRDEVIKYDGVEEE